MSYGSNTMNAVYDTQLGENDHLGREVPTRRAKRCLCLVFCLIPVLMVVLLLEILSVNVSSFHYISKNNLLIPINSSFKLPVDSAKYSAIKFFAYYRDDVDNVKFIIRSVPTVTVPRVREGNVFSTADQCTLSRDDAPCIILRYWPFDEYYYDGSVSCKSDDPDGNSYLAWTWFNPRGIIFGDITDSFKCPSPSSSNVYICSDYEALDVSHIYDQHGPHKGHYLLAFQFCPGIVNGVPEEDTTVSYTFSFQEAYQPLQYTDNDIYTFSQQGKFADTTWIVVTIPLHAEVDSNVYITYSASADQTDVDQFIEIEYQMIQNVYLVGTSVRERVNSAFMVVCMIFLCTIMIFITYYIKKY